METAEKLVRRAGHGETVSTPMVFQEPDIFGDDVYFRDVLGHCETKHTQDENRNNNLRRACESMNGVILQPGEVFSYNDTLGPRTKENGYLRAGAYSGWELVQSYGGGICQGSTTIYGAALYADLEIVHRKNHGYMVGYTEPGLDATVNWGGPDFQFRNSSHFPIKIEAEVSDGFVKVTILGTEDRDYYIEMESEAQWGDSTIYAKSYKCRYDRETHELISRELEARSNYMR
jgi:vancomycin resistance protein YoaR